MADDPRRSRHRPPYALWLQGPVDLRYGCLRSVAVVGSRAASPTACAPPPTSPPSSPTRAGR
ncbi:hypothetical protein [Actinomadura madurae]|uniref:hypothetical protein n=1 Tax=Actinomadura madurae TaxID=1993 RepID=UPI0027E30C3C|nr:hypothetical protein [Actinomadura madurae]